MNTNLIIKNTIIGLVAGTIGHSTFAGDQLSSLVDDGSYTPAQRAEMIFGTVNRDVQNPAEAKSVSDTNATDNTIAHVKAGTVDIKSGDEARAFGIVRAKGSTTEVNVSSITVNATGKSKAVAYMEGDVDMS